MDILLDPDRMSSVLKSGSLADLKLLAGCHEVHSSRVLGLSVLRAILDQFQPTFEWTDVLDSVLSGNSILIEALDSDLTNTRPSTEVVLLRILRAKLDIVYDQLLGLVASLANFGNLEDLWRRFSSEYVRNVLVSSGQWAPSHMGLLMGDGRYTAGHSFLSKHRNLSPAHLGALGSAAIPELSAEPREIEEAGIFLVALLSSGWRPASEDCLSLMSVQAHLSEKGNTTGAILLVLYHPLYPLKRKALEDILRLSVHNSFVAHLAFVNAGKILRQPGRTCEDAVWFLSALRTKQSLSLATAGQDMLGFVTSAWAEELWPTLWEMLCPGGAWYPGDTAPLNALLPLLEAIARLADVEQYRQFWDSLGAGPLRDTFFAAANSTQLAALPMETLEHFIHHANPALRQQAILAIGSGTAPSALDERAQGVADPKGRLVSIGQRVRLAYEAFREGVAG